MDVKRRARYEDKIAHLEKYYSTLLAWMNDVGIIPEDDLDPHLYAVYHVFQRTLEVIADLAAMCVKDLGRGPKDDYSNITILREEKIITHEEILKLNRLNGLRNRITHDYNGLNDQQAINSILECHDIIPLFLESIKNWLLIQ